MTESPGRTQLLKHAWKREVATTVEVHRPEHQESRDKPHRNGGIPSFGSLISSTEPVMHATYRSISVLSRCAGMPNSMIEHTT